MNSLHYNLHFQLSLFLVTKVEKRWFNISIKTKHKNSGHLTNSTIAIESFPYIVCNSIYLLESAVISGMEPLSGSMPGNKDEGISNKNYDL